MKPQVAFRYKDRWVNRKEIGMGEQWESHQDYLNKENRTDRICGSIDKLVETLEKLVHRLTEV